MEIRVLGAHNCESESTRLTSLLIDSSLAIDAGGITSSLSFSAQQKLKAILLTHQHYDHIRDIPALAMNFALRGKAINIYSTQPVYEVLSSYLLDGMLYPKFLEMPSQNPTVRFVELKINKIEHIENYAVLAVRVNHSVPTAGYQITSQDGKAVFYTGDTGPGLEECWQRVSPQLLITEVTFPDRYEEFIAQSGHFTPKLLKEELLTFLKIKGYLPKVIGVHMDPGLEQEISSEVASIAKKLNASIELAYEGMKLRLIGKLN